MTDPWFEAADTIREERERQAAEQRTAADEKQEKERREREEATAKEQALEAAIAAAVPALERFMEERGAAAQALLAARSIKAHVLFGADADGGYYSSVYLDHGGIRKERGHKVGYGSERTGGPDPATAREAVEYFVRHGSGRRDPAKAATIVDWLTRQIDGYAKPA